MSGPVPVTTVPFAFATKAGNVPAQQLDLDFSAVLAGLDSLQVQINALQAQVNALPITGITGALIFSLDMQGSRLGDYTTASAAFVDVDPTNLKTPTLTVPAGAKFLIAMASFSLGLSNINDGNFHVRILAGAAEISPAAFLTGILPGASAPLTMFGVLTTPPPGPLTVSLQFRGDGANAITIRNQSGEGMASSGTPNFVAEPVTVPQMLVMLTN